MDAEELLKKLLEDPDIAKKVEHLWQDTTIVSVPEKKKRGRPKKVSARVKKDEHIHIINAKIPDQDDAELKKKYGRTESFNKNKLKKLQFISDGVEKDKIDEILYVQDPVPRTRKSKVITKICETCGKKVKVSSLIIASYFRCDECIINRRNNE